MKVYRSTTPTYGGVDVEDEYMNYRQQQMAEDFAVVVTAIIGVVIALGIVYFVS